MPGSHPDVETMEGVAASGASSHRASSGVLSLSSRPSRWRSGKAMATTTSERCISSARFQHAVPARRGVRRAARSGRGCLTGFCRCGQDPPPRSTRSGTTRQRWPGSSRLLDGPAAQRWLASLGSRSTCRNGPARRVDVRRRRTDGQATCPSPRLARRAPGQDSIGERSAGCKRGSRGGQGGGCRRTGITD